MYSLTNTHNTSLLSSTFHHIWWWSKDNYPRVAVCVCAVNLKCAHYIYMRQMVYNLQINLCVCVCLEQTMFGWWTTLNIPFGVLWACEYVCLCVTMIRDWRPTCVPASTRKMWRRQSIIVHRLNASRSTKMNVLIFSISINMYECVSRLQAHRDSTYILQSRVYHITWHRIAHIHRHTRSHSPHINEHSSVEHFVRYSSNFVHGVHGEPGRQLAAQCRQTGAYIRVSGHWPRAVSITWNSVQKERLQSFSMVSYDSYSDLCFTCSPFTRPRGKKSHLNPANLMRIEYRQAENEPKRVVDVDSAHARATPFRKRSDQLRAPFVQ